MSGLLQAPHAADQGIAIKLRDFSPISTEVEMISHTNDALARVRPPSRYQIAASLADASG